MKGNIHRYVLSTISFLCDIGEPRYRQNNTGYQNIKIVNYRLTLFLRPDNLHSFAYISAPWYSTEDCLYWKCTYICHLSFEYKQYSVQYREAEIQAKQCRISDFKNRILIYIWPSWYFDTLYCFAYISAPRYRTEN